MLSIPNVILTKCNLYEMLPIQSVLYEMLPRQNVTIRKCTIQNVTDPQNPEFTVIHSVCRYACKFVCKCMYYA